MKNKIITLKKGKDMPVKAGHPWIFSGGIEKTEGKISNGEIADIYSSSGEYLATGSFHQGNSIRVRVISRKRNESIDTDFFIKRFKSLASVKKELLPAETDGYRLVHSDADMMPGLVVDIYGGSIVFQINTAAMEVMRQDIIEALAAVFKPVSIVEKSDMDNRKMDNLKALDPVIRYGGSTGPAFFNENGITMISDMLEGQKTGFYLDQRDARIFIKGISKGKRVLNLFSYTGGFSISAAAGGASEITSVDASERALEIAREIFAVNSTKGSGTGSNFPWIKNIRTEFIREDVFDFLARLLKQKKTGAYDIIICDPPAFAKKREHAADALKGYTSLNRMCFEASSSGTVLVSSSCSGMIGWTEFTNMLRLASGQAGKGASIIADFSQASDHTRKISFPEGSYLKTTALLVE